MPTGALGPSKGLMEQGEGPNGHMGALGSMQGLGAPSLTHCISCGVWWDGKEDGTSYGRWWDGTQGSVGCPGHGAGSSCPHQVLPSPLSLSPTCAGAKTSKSSSGVTKALPQRCKIGRDVEVFLS